MGEISLDLERGKEIRDARKVLRITSQTGIRFCLCKLDKINVDEKTGIDWRERCLINKFYMNRSVKYEWTKGRQEV